MKKAITGILAGCMVLSMAGCAADAATVPDTEITTTTSAVLTATEGSKQSAEITGSTTSGNGTTGSGQSVTGGKTTGEGVHEPPAQAPAATQNPGGGQAGSPAKAPAGTTAAPAKPQQPNKPAATTTKKKTTTTKKKTTQAPTKPASPYDKKATAADAKAIADRTLYYINQYRTAQGGKAATKLPGLTQVAEYRSKQLVTNFAHDTDDEREANAALQYGEIKHLSNGTSYYSNHARSAIGQGGGYSIDDVAQSLANGVHNSAGHWAYVGSSEYPYMAIGVTLSSVTWYCCIYVSETNQYG